MEYAYTFLIIVGLISWLFAMRKAMKWIDKKARDEE